MSEDSDEVLRRHQNQLELLYNVLSNRRMARFIASLQCYKLYDECSGGDLGFYVTKFMDYTEDFRNAVWQYSNANTRDNWELFRMLQYSPDSTLALLLTLLPNLRHVYIWEPGSNTSRMIDDIARRYRQKGRASDHLALANLTSVFFEIQYDCQTVWDMASLPSIRSLRVCINCRPSPWGPRTIEFLPYWLVETSLPLLPCLNSLDICNAKVERSDLCEFLANTKQLRRFHFQTCDAPIDVGMTGLFPEICSSLSKHASSTLEDLKLKDNRPFSLVERRSKSYMIKSLKEFTKLKKIEIDEILFTGRLVDALPTSTETLVLLENYRCLEDPGARFKDLAKLRSTRLPCLSSITYRRHFRGFRRQTFDNLGITFVKE